MMILAIRLFETDLTRIVSISYTSLILNELILVGLEVSTWHRVMVLSQVFSILIYTASMFILKKEFGRRLLFEMSGASMNLLISR
jgi:phospholipid-translocating ATPase